MGAMDLRGDGAHEPRPVVPPSPSWSPWVIACWPPWDHRPRYIRATLVQSDWSQRIPCSRARRRCWCELERRRDGARPRLSELTRRRLAEDRRPRWGLNRPEWVVFTALPPRRPRGPWNRPSLVVVVSRRHRTARQQLTRGFA